MRRLLNFLDEHAAQVIVILLAAAVTVLGVTAYLVLKSSSPLSTF